jgi:dTDP-4-amino-4,6-dideoxygalactose transaminase
VLNYFNKIELKNTEKVSKRVLSLPYFAFPEEKELDYLIDTIVRFK